MSTVSELLPAVDASSESPSYWQSARRPFAALLFLLPILGIYEFGIMSVGTESSVPRNGADHWMRSWLIEAGFAYHWVLPVLVVVSLLAWHLSAGDRWCCSLDTLGGMLGESLLFAVLLILCGQILSATFRRNGLPTASIFSLAAGAAPVEAATSNGIMPRVVSFLGAGIYEEVMFRLMAIPVCFYLLRAVLVPRAIAAGTAILMTTFLFALAHYLGPDASSLSLATAVDAAWNVADNESLWYGFTFRLTAGLCFSLLFVTRGFGITVGSHAIYDILVGIAMQGV